MLKGLVKNGEFEKAFTILNVEKEIEDKQLKRNESRYYRSHVIPDLINILTKKQQYSIALKYILEDKDYLGCYSQGLLLSDIIYAIMTTNFANKKEEMEMISTLKKSLFKKATY